MKEKPWAFLCSDSDVLYCGFGLTGYSIYLLSAVVRNEDGNTFFPWVSSGDPEMACEGFSLKQQEECVWTNCISSSFSLPHLKLLCSPEGMFLKGDGKAEKTEQEGRVLDARETVEASAPRLAWETEFLVTTVLMLRVFCSGHSLPSLSLQLD